MTKKHVCICFHQKTDKLSYLKHKQERKKGFVVCVSPGIGGTANVHASHPVPPARSGQEHIRHIQLSL